MRGEIYEMGDVCNVRCMYCAIYVMGEMYEMAEMHERYYV